MMMSCAPDNHKLIHTSPPPCCFLFLALFRCQTLKPLAELLQVDLPTLQNEYLCARPTALHFARPDHAAFSFVWASLVAMQVW